MQYAKSADSNLKVLSLYKQKWFSDEKKKKKKGGLLVIQSWEISTNSI